MFTIRVALVYVAAFSLGSSPTLAQAQSSNVRMYNTVKQKLMRGEQVVGGTIYTDDPNIYSAMAESGFDLLWIEMQHSPLMYDEVAWMIWASKDAPAIPFIRIPDATEGDIQKARTWARSGLSFPWSTRWKRLSAPFVTRSILRLAFVARAVVNTPGSGAEIIGRQ